MILILSMPAFNVHFWRTEESAQMWATDSINLLLHNQSPNVQTEIDNAVELFKDRIALKDTEGPSRYPLLAIIVPAKDAFTGNLWEAPVYKDHYSSLRVGDKLEYHAGEGARDEHVTLFWMEEKCLHSQHGSTS